MDIYGTDGPDRIPGTVGDDRIFAMGGNDIIAASAGVDVVDGGAGNDIVQFNVPAAFGAGPEADGGRLFTVTGSRADGGRVTESGGRFDTSFSNVESLSFINAGPFAMTVDATGARNVVLNLLGSSQYLTAQKLVAGDGDDRINASRGIVDIDAGGGNDFVSVGVTGIVIAGQRGDGAVELHQDNPGGQLLATIAHAETLNFYSSNPTNGAFFDASALRVGVILQGTDRPDTLIGGSGADALLMIGRGTDFDHLSGGLGTDDFFAASFDSLAAATRIGDFEGRDRIDFSDPALYDLNAPHFIGSAAFSGAAGEYRFSTTDGHQTLIEIDVDGDGVANSAISLGERGFLLRETAAGSNILEIDSGAGLRVGTLANDRLDGDDRANFLYGYDGDDTLTAGGGNDLLEGGAGTDTLRGGAGADAFLFDTEGRATGRDRIVDFGRSDILVTTEELVDNNHDGRIDFGRNKTLDLVAIDGDLQGQIAITGENGARITALEYDGFYDAGGSRYFVYSLVGSPAGIATLTQNDFAGLLGTPVAG